MHGSPLVALLNEKASPVTYKEDLKMLLRAFWGHMALVLTVLQLTTGVSSSNPQVSAAASTD